MRDFFQQENTLSNPFFVADVEDNNDPTGNYRIKVRIPKIHNSNISSANLPWAAKLDSSFLGIGGSYINHSIPEIGTKVLILAVGNDLNSLIYLGVLSKKTDVSPTGSSYTDTFGIYTSSGNFLGIDKITKTLKLIYEGHINIDKILDGKINITDKLEVSCPVIRITGDVKIEGNLNVSKTITSNEVKTTAGVDLNRHIHSGVYPGSDNTTPPVQ